VTERAADADRAHDRVWVRRIRGDLPVLVVDDTDLTGLARAYDREEVDLAVRRGVGRSNGPGLSDVVRKGNKDIGVVPECDTPIRRCAVLECDEDPALQLAMPRDGDPRKIVVDRPVVRGGRERSLRADRRDRAQGPEGRAPVGGHLECNRRAPET